MTPRTVILLSPGKPSVRPLSIDVPGRQVFLDGGGDRADAHRVRHSFRPVVQAGRGWSRRQLIDSIWGEPWVGNDHLVDVHVGHVRRKLGDSASEPRFVMTVRGVGYRMGEPGDMTVMAGSACGRAFCSPNHWCWWLVG